SRRAAASRGREDGGEQDAAEAVGGGPPLPLGQAQARPGIFPRLAMRRVATALLMLLALAAPVRAQGLLPLLQPHEQPNEGAPAGKTDAERSDETQKTLDTSKAELDKARQDLAAETDTLETRAREIRAALDASPAQEEARVLGVERDAISDRLGLLR